MSWVQIKGPVNASNAPRRLTDSEINAIIDKIDKPPASDNYSSEVLAGQIKDIIRDNLTKIEVCPNRIQHLSNRIQELCNQAASIPGTAVGVAAAEALMAILTQLTLNTFHSSGSSKSVSSGIESITSVIKASKTIKNPTCFLYFVDKKMSAYDVISSRSYIVGSKATDFIKSYTITDYDPDAPRPWWWKIQPEIVPEGVVKFLRIKVNSNEMVSQKVTMKMLAYSIETKMSNNTNHIESFYGLSDEDKQLMNKLDKLVSKTKGGEINPVIVYCGSSSDGIIDIFPRVIDGNGLKGVNKEIAPQVTQEAFLEDFVQSAMEKIIVKGVEGITKLDIQPIPVLSVIGKEERNGDLWTIHLNRFNSLRYGIDSNRIVELFEEAGIIVHEQEDYKLVVSVPKDLSTYFSDEVFEDTYQATEIIAPDLRKKYGEDIFEVCTYPGRDFDPARFNELCGKAFLRVKDQQDQKFIVQLQSPVDYVRSRLDRDKEIVNKNRADAQNANIQRAKETGDKTYELLPVPINPTRLMLLGDLYYGEADGNNIEELFLLPQIDKNISYTNNMNIINRLFGAEITRSFIAYTINTIITGSGSFVHPSHIMTISEFIMSRGEPFGATYTGVSRQPVGHFSLASMEQASKVLIDYAAIGGRETSDNVSAAIALGAQIKIGTGSFDIGMDVETIDGNKTLINQKVFDGFVENPDLVNSAVEQSEEETNVSGLLDFVDQIEFDVNPTFEIPTATLTDEGLLVKQLKEQLFKPIQIKKQEQDLVDGLVNPQPFIDVSKTFKPPKILEEYLPVVRTTPLPEIDLKTVSDTFKLTPIKDVDYDSFLEAL